MKTKSAPCAAVELKVICRLDGSQDARFRLKRGSPFIARATDISEVGAELLSKYLIPRGIILDLDIDGKVFGLDRNIKTKGEVRFCESVKGLWKSNRIGVKFLDISDVDREALAKFVAAYERRRCPRARLAG